MYIEYLTSLPRSMPNADKCPSKSWHWSKIPLSADWCRSIPLNVDQCRSMPDQAALIWHWLELIDIGSMPELWSALIYHWSSIDRHSHLCQLLRESAKRVHLGGMPPNMPLWFIVRFSQGLGPIERCWATWRVLEVEGNGYCGREG